MVAIRVSVRQSPFLRTDGAVALDRQSV